MSTSGCQILNKSTQGATSRRKPVVSPASKFTQINNVINKENQ